MLVKVEAMRKKSAKKQTKRKKLQPTSFIRTDVWLLSLTGEQRNLAILTVEEYRHFLKPLVLIAYWNWEALSNRSVKERVNTPSNKRERGSSRFVNGGGNATRQIHLP